MRKTIEQERASFCLKEIQEFKSNNENNKDVLKKFKTASMRLSQLIVSNGLISTIAFYKGKEDKKQVYEILNKWLKQQGYITNDLLKDIINQDVNKLRLATIEALALANWLKRLVEVEIEVEE